MTDTAPSPPAGPVRGTVSQPVTRKEIAAGQQMTALVPSSAARPITATLLSQLRVWVALIPTGGRPRPAAGGSSLTPVRLSPGCGPVSSAKGGTVWLG
jgi:hypothetical protein